MGDPLMWRRAAHVPVLVILQIIFIILFGVFVVYDPNSAIRTDVSLKNVQSAIAVYPAFQDVHVMIFFGFGFLMMFLKKYALSSVSLTMVLSVITLEWAALVIGFFHLHESHTITAASSDHGHGPKPAMDGNHTDAGHADASAADQGPENGSGYIYINVLSLLICDFTAATILISFGAVIGKATPLQLIVMVVIETVLYVVSEVIGRNYLGAVDAGDTIFVHLFGCYFGLATSKFMYNQRHVTSENAAPDKMSDLFSMAGTVFLWLFWPSFNSATAVNEGQHRAVINTYFSLCGSVMGAFAVSALTDKNKKFVMEHVQNSTLAGGVAIGAVADMPIGVFAALIIGFVAGSVSAFGFRFLNPFLDEKLRFHDTCGVHKLHGIPAVIGCIANCIMSALATPESYGGEDALKDVFPDRAGYINDQGEFVEGRTASRQAVIQMVAQIITASIAVVGGACTGIIMTWVGKWQHVDELFHSGPTSMKMMIPSLGQVENQAAPTLMEDRYYQDDVFFVVHGEEGGHGESDVEDATMASPDARGIHKTGN